jgi:hypothetical protein
MDAKAPSINKPKRGRAVARGRPVGSKNKRPGGRSDLVDLGDNSGPARFFRKMLRDVEADLGSRRFLSRIECELIRAFCGSATLLQVQNVQIAIGDTTEVNIGEYTALVSAMIRVSMRLGLSTRKTRDVTPSLDQFLDHIRSENDAATPGEANNDMSPAGIVDVVDDGE